MNKTNQLNCLFQQAYGHITAKALHIAVEIDLHKILLLGQGQVKISDLAEKLEFDSLGFFRLVRILETTGILEIIDEKYIKATEITHLLEYIDSPYISLSYKNTENLLSSCKKNSETFSETYDDLDFYSYLQQKELTKKFDSWCAKTADLWLHTIIEIYDFSNCKTIADIGGGEGILLSAILKNNEDLTGIVIDRQDVISKVNQNINMVEIQDRIKFQAGNFFDSTTLPKNKNTYILSRTLLNWTNDDAVQILNSICDVMSIGSKLLVIDFYIPSTEDELYKFSVLSDTALHLTFGGANRTINEWNELICQSKLNIENIQYSPTDSHSVMPLFIMELKK